MQMKSLRQAEERERLKSQCLPLKDFIARLTNHIPDHYQHSVRYFGLLAPRLRRIAGSILESEIPHALNRGRVNPTAKKPWVPKDSRGNVMYSMVGITGAHVVCAPVIPTTNRYLQAIVFCVVIFVLPNNLYFKPQLKSNVRKKSYVIKRGRILRIAQETWNEKDDQTAACIGTESVLLKESLCTMWRRKEKYRKIYNSKHFYLFPPIRIALCSITTFWHPAGLCKQSVSV